MILTDLICELSTFSTGFSTRGPGKSVDKSCVFFLCRKNSTDLHNSVEYYLIYITLFALRFHLLKKAAGSQKKKTAIGGLLVKSVSGDRTCPGPAGGL